MASTVSQLNPLFPGPGGPSHAVIGAPSPALVEQMLRLPGHIQAVALSAHTIMALATALSTCQGTAVNPSASPSEQLIDVIQKNSRAIRHEVQIIKNMIAGVKTSIRTLGASDPITAQRALARLSNIESEFIHQIPTDLPFARPEDDQPMPPVPSNSIDIGHYLADIEMALAQLPKTKCFQDLSAQIAAIKREPNLTKKEAEIQRLDSLLAPESLTAENPLFFNLTDKQIVTLHADLYAVKKETAALWESKIKSAKGSTALKKLQSLLSLRQKGSSQKLEAAITALVQKTMDEITADTQTTATQKLKQLEKFQELSGFSPTELQLITETLSTIQEARTAELAIETAQNFISPKSQNRHKSQITAMTSDADIGRLRPAQTTDGNLNQAVEKTIADLIQNRDTKIQKMIDALPNIPLNSTNLTSIVSALRQALNLQAQLMSSHPSPAPDSLLSHELERLESYIVDTLQTKISQLISPLTAQLEAYLTQPNGRVNWKLCEQTRSILGDLPIGQEFAQLLNLASRAAQLNQSAVELQATPASQLMDMTDDQIESQLDPFLDEARQIDTNAETIGLSTNYEQKLIEYQTALKAKRNTEIARRLGLLCTKAAQAHSPETVKNEIDILRSAQASYQALMDVPSIPMSSASFPLAQAKTTVATQITALQTQLFTKMATEWQSYKTSLNAHIDANKVTPDELKLLSKFAFDSSHYLADFPQARSLLADIQTYASDQQGAQTVFLQAQQLITQTKTAILNWEPKNIYVPLTATQFTEIDATLRNLIGLSNHASCPAALKDKIGLQIKKLLEQIKQKINVAIPIICNKPIPSTITPVLLNTIIQNLPILRSIQAQYHFFLTGSPEGTRLDQHIRMLQRILDTNYQTHCDTLRLQAANPSTARAPALSPQMASTLSSAISPVTRNENILRDTISAINLAAVSSQYSPEDYQTWKSQLLAQIGFARDPQLKETAITLLIGISHQIEVSTGAPARPAVTPSAINTTYDESAQSRVTADSHILTLKSDPTIQIPTNVPLTFVSAMQFLDHVLNMPLNSTAFQRYLDTLMFLNGKKLEDLIPSLNLSAQAPAAVYYGTPISTAVSVSPPPGHHLSPAQEAEELEQFVRDLDAEPPPPPPPPFPLPEDLDDHEDVHFEAPRTPGEEDAAGD